MGISGLEYFIQKNFDALTDRVKLSEIANLYRKEMKKEPVMLVDISSCISSLLTTSSQSKILIGDLKKIEEIFEIFINKLSDAGIKLKIIFDGMKANEKKWIQRRKRCVSQLKNIYTKEKTFSECDLLGIGIFLYLAEETILSMDKCEIWRALYEADTDIIHLMKKEPCFAVLARDTDFLMAEGAQYVLSAKHFDLDSMTAVNYNREKLAKFLNITPSELIFFGSFFFSHYFNYKLVKSFYKKNKISDSNVHLDVAKFVKKNSVYIKKIPNNKLKPYAIPGLNEEILSAVKKELEIFSGSNFRKDVPSSEDQHWNDIILLAKEKFTKLKFHKCILEILVNKKQFLNCVCSNVLEALPVTSFKPFRQKIYGILFAECPDKNVRVTEYCLENFAEGTPARLNISKVSFEPQSHPGLKVLWSSTPQNKEQKVEFFCQTIHPKLKPDDLKNIPEVFLLLFFTVFYLVWELKGKIKLFEMETILIQAVLVNRLTAEEILKYPENINLDALNLSSWFLESVNYLNVLNSVCGVPFEKSSTLSFFDGKVFQDVWTKIKDGRNISEIFSHEIYEVFKILKENILKLGFKCYGYEDPWKRE